MADPRRVAPFAAAIARSVGDIRNHFERPHYNQTAILTTLRRVILDAEAPPGSPIPLNDVATAFGVSAIPVREALKILVGEGLVTHRVNDGYFVAQLTQSELIELYVVRGALEQTALARAIAARTQADVAAATTAHEAMAAARTASEVSRQSRVFHDALVRASAMPRLLGIFAEVWNMTEPSRVMAGVDAATTAHLVSDHAEMLAMFAAGDEAGLLAAAASHNRHLLEAVNTARDHSP